VAIDLRLTETLPPLLHGDGGLSQKGPDTGNASYYYSIVQQQVNGTVIIGGDSFEVTGKAWKDHEYSTSALGEEAVGWDWFSLQMDDGSALMFYQIRRTDGTLEPFSSGTYIRPDGSTRHLSRGDWQLEVLDTWVSPSSGAEYPAGWRILVPQLAVELTGRPESSDQELKLSTTYWEGAVSFEGTIGGQPASALGYVEMTGYAEAMSGRM
jgi:predicted secreted hydrolase